MSMGSDISPQLIGKANVEVEVSMARDCSGRKNQKKAPKKIHKAEREKLKREQLNDLFLDLANALELAEQNNGKASILCEANRLLKDLFWQIESLKKENASLLSESHYVATEKKELLEENSALENQIEKLQCELNARVVQSKPDLNVPPPLDFPPLELTRHFPSEGPGLPLADPRLQPTHAVFVIPVHPDLQAFPSSEVTQIQSNVSKPHARYPTPADSWPSQLLKEQQTEASREFRLSGNENCADTEQRVPDDK